MKEMYVPDKREQEKKSEELFLEDEKRKKMQEG